MRTFMAAGRGDAVCSLDRLEQLDRRSQCDIRPLAEVVAIDIDRDALVRAYSASNRGDDSFTRIRVREAVPIGERCERGARRLGSVR
jgi:hypothetical protein